MTCCSYIYRYTLFPIYVIIAKEFMAAPSKVLTKDNVPQRSKFDQRTSTVLS